MSPPPRTPAHDARLAVLGTVAGLAAVADEWDALAAAAGSPFLTIAWLTAWWGAFGRGRLQVAVLRDAAGRLLAGACCQLRHRALEATANRHSGDWDVVAVDEAARRRLWRELARLAPGRLRLPGLVTDAPGTEAARQELIAAGHRLTELELVPCPHLDLPGDFEALRSSVSRNHRSQLGRRRRALEREGAVTFRTVTGGDELGEALDRMLRIEAGGWKGRERSAVLSDPATEALYRGFAPRAATRGWLRLHLLELDGEPIAADFGLAFAGTGFLLKTGFDERLARFSPGGLLRADVLRSSIEEGLRAYEFLGAADAYKLRWRPEMRPRLFVGAYRGRAGMSEWAYRQYVRPQLKRGANAARRRLAARDGQAPAPA
jgi:CelD/BcsL family acetyltransferase involved in cellulose biosynthesis